MLDPNHPISAFFDTDADRVLASLAHLDASSGKVTTTDTLMRPCGESELRAVRRGIFCQVIFGPQRSLECACGTLRGKACAGETCTRCGVLCGDPATRAVRFGHVETAGVVHPAVYGHLLEDLHHDTLALRAVACGEKALRGSKLVADLSELEDGDLMGPRGIAEALRRARPGHPLLPLCTVTKIPIPPPAARPLRQGSAPEQIDPWIGPVNEAWRSVIERAYLDLRLIELNAPPILTTNAAGALQRAFEAMLAETRTAEAKLVPSLRRGLDSDAVALAFAGPERLVIQRGDATRIVDVSGRALHVAPPAGCQLRGVAAQRFAVFHGLHNGIHPIMTDEVDVWPAWYAHDDDDGVRRITPTVDELSVLDVDAGAFLANVPEEVPRDYVYNDQPEELFVGTRKLRVGNDRPTLFAYTHDLRFAWVGEESTEIIDRETGLPVVYPANAGEATQGFALAKGEMCDVESDLDAKDTGAAIAFTGGRWLVLWPQGVLTDHLGTDPLQLVPPPAAAAFDPGGERLAVIHDGEVVILDHRARKVVARFPA